MKHYFVVLSLILICLGEKSMGQAKDPVPDSLIVLPTKYVITIGLLHGGSILGGDVEMRLFDGAGIQLGFGAIGFSTGFNFHFDRDIKSSYVSIMYVHQGFGNLFLQNMFGPAYVHRWKNGLSTQVGVGFLSEYGAKWGRNFEDNIPPAIQPMIALGYYF